MGLFGHDDDKKPEEQGAADSGQTPTSDTPAAPQTGGSDDQWATPPSDAPTPPADTQPPVEGDDTPAPEAGEGDTPAEGGDDQGDDEQMPPAAPQQ
ncbi:MAG TPA: hypothetical protein VLF60_02415 [Candidatus Saccharimonadales bacterium]|nr:hypothetical protein [Candidatus Saccharimonadales bacterium]